MFNQAAVPRPMSSEPRKLQRDLALIWLNAGLNYGHAKTEKIA